MMTRSLLFLIAVITGLSAPHLRADMRPTAAEVGAAASTAQQQAAIIWINDARPAKAHHAIMAIAADRLSAMWLLLHAPISILPAARIFIGDRNRQ